MQAVPHTISGDVLIQALCTSLGALSIYAFWGRVFLQVISLGFAWVLLQQIRALLRERRRSGETGVTTAAKVASLERQLKRTEEEHHATLIRMKQQQNKVLLQMNELESRLSQV